MHIPVLLKEVIEYLNPQPDEDFIDATFGEGGHAQEILKLTSPEGRLLGIDLDPSTSLDQARDKSLRASLGFRLDTGSAYLKASEPLVPRSSSSEVGLSWSGIEPEPFDKLRASLSKDFQGRLFLENENFAEIENFSKQYFPDGVDGVLFDFGFRSFHIDESGRGFSYTKDEPLDMRYSYRSETSIGGTTAADIVNGWSENELERIFIEFGEERDSRKIAKAITEARKHRRILTTKELVMVIDGVVLGYRVKTYSRIFQALRIAVNNELENIKKGLEGAWKILKPNGRLVVISFHSLEDRIVKNFFNEKKELNEGVVLTKKPVIATEEVTANTRSRSAKLRAIKKK